jgi:hypothetical protein
VGANNKGDIAKQCNAFGHYSFPVTLLSCRASRARATTAQPLIVFARLGIRVKNEIVLGNHGLKTARTARPVGTQFQW